MVALVVIVVIFIAVYVASLFLSPYVKCSRCKNKPKRRGWVLSVAMRKSPLVAR